MVTFDPIAVEGLREFVRSLKALGADLPKAVRVAANQAAEVVVQDARQKVPKRSGKAASSIKAKSTRTAARVASGGPRAPYMPWLDYGGRVGRGRSIERPFIKTGRYVYPSFFANRVRVQEVFKEELLKIAEQAGLDLD